MTVHEALSYIHTVCWRGSKPGLSRTRTLLSKMGNPEKKLKFIHIAGTNGKGSTAAMLASILQKAGYVTGLYTSPYIVRFGERMQVNGQMIEDDELCRITERLRPLADEMPDHPTEFEFVTAVAMEFFARHGCQIVVLEVGLGGELDSTNVIDVPEAAVICNIGLDHTEILGDTLEKIAAAKAGIIKPGGQVVIYRGSESVEAVFEEKCRAVGAVLHKAEFDSIRPLYCGLDGQRFDCGEYRDLTLPLLGEHQLRNAAVVLKTVQVLRERGWDVSDANVREGLSCVRWPGRFEILRREPLFIIDGGHNPQCIEALEQNVRQYLGGRELTVLTGVLADKDYHSMYAGISQYASRFFTVTPPNPRALSAQELAAYLTRFGKPVTVCDSVEAGVKQALAAAGKDGAVLAYGSLYMLGDVIHALDAEGS